MALNTSFVPSALVDWLHERPRFGESKDITTVDWNDVSGMEDASYTKGVVYLFAVFIAIAFFTFLFTCFAACMACCKRCCYKEKRPHASLDDKGGNGPQTRPCRRFVFVVLTLLIVACSLASMYIISQINDASGDTVDVMDDIGDVVDRTMDLNDDIAAVLTLAESNATAINAVDPVQGGPLLSNIQAALSDVQDVSDSGDEFQKRIDDASDDTEHRRDDGELWGWVYVCIVAVWAILTSLAVLCCKQRTCFLRLSILLGILLLWLLWVVTGLFFLLSLLSADLCTNPDNNIISVAAAEPPFTSDTEAAATLYYIIGCAENSLDTMGVTKLVDDTVTTFRDAEADLDAITPTVATQQYVDNIEAHFVLVDGILTGSQGMTTQVSCATTNGLYKRGRDNICDDLLNPLIQLFGLQLASSFLLFVAIMVAMPFWNARSKDDASEASMRPVMSPQVGHGNSVPY